LEELLRSFAKLAIVRLVARMPPNRRLNSKELRTKIATFFEPVGIDEAASIVAEILSNRSEECVVVH